MMSKFYYQWQNSVEAREIIYCFQSIIFKSLKYFLIALGKIKTVLDKTYTHMKNNLKRKWVEGRNNSLDDVFADYCVMILFSSCHLSKYCMMPEIMSHVYS